MLNLTHVDPHKAPVFTMQDDLGIVYHIESAQQFWSELEDVLRLPEDDAPTLSMLDSTLRRFLALCATYHEQYLQSPLQIEHACNLLVGSELFEFHSERMLDIVVDDAQTITDPHFVFVFYEVLFHYGHRRPDFFRSHKRWQPLLPLLMDHILVEIDPDTEDTYVGTTTGRNASFSSVPIPIEAKVRSLSVRTLYDVCKVQTLSVQDLKIFGDSFIDYLFDLVEQTKYMQDETFNYSVIKLIIALNEQFMVAGLGDEEGNPNSGKAPEPKNRVIRVMMRRLGSCKTFGENMIFMLNRAKRSHEDFCVKLLILKILYVLFSNRGTCEFFYTNDLCVLVDVFLRELADLDEDSESLRHTYLRVLHPLLTRTQLRDVPYKRPQILVALEGMVGHSRIREVTPTTKRLVERCLSGPWCVQLMELRKEARYDPKRVGSPSSDLSTILMSPDNMGPSAAQHLDSSKVMMSLKYSKSVEHLGRAEPLTKQQLKLPLDQARRPSNASVHSLPGFAEVATSSKVPPLSINASAAKKRSTSAAADAPAHVPRHNSLPLEGDHELNNYHYQEPSPHSPHSPRSSLPSPVSSLSPNQVSILEEPATQIVAQSPRRRRPPPAPPKRHKPPPIPVGRTNSGATITTLRSSEPSPLSKSHKIGVQQVS